VTLTRRTRVVLHVAAVVAVTGLGFTLLQGPARHVEAQLAAALVRVTAGEHVRAVGASSIEVLPLRHEAFRAIVTPSCSSIGSLLALACLGALSRHRRRAAGATAAAMATVAAGNVVRIAASLAVGLVAGRASLVLFHDWVGSMFGFAYTLGGFLLLLWLLLPRRQVQVVAA